MRLQRFILPLLCSVLLCFLMASCSSRRSRMRQQHRKEMRDRRNSNDDSNQLGNGKTSIIGIVRGSNNGKALTPEEIYRRCNPAVFTVKMPDRTQGSGFFINESGVAVTNYHVLGASARGYVILADNRAYQIVEVLKANQELDYAIFRVGISDKVPFLPISRKNVVIGEKAYAIGSPKGVNNTFSQGIVSQKRGHLIQISVPIDHGSSGGALLNEYGEVIGVTTSRVDSNADLNFAIDIHMLPL